MKKTARKMLSLFLVLVTVITTSAIAALPVSATSRTVQEALNWCASLVGKWYDYDNKNGPQCVDLIYGYYNYLGVTPAWGNGIDYASNALPAGWQRIQGAAPQPGDILVYTNGTYGHVAIYGSSSVIYHIRPSYSNYVLAESTAYNLFPQYWGVIRPNFASSSTPSASVLTITGMNYPIHKQSGQPLEIFGLLSSPYLITCGEAIVYDMNRNVKFHIGTYAENGRYTFNLNEFDKNMKFASLPDGQYIYFVQALDEKGYYAFYETNFTVGSGATTQGSVDKIVGDHNCDSSNSWNAGVVKKAATCAYTGEKVYTCTVCSKTKTEVIPKTAHTYGEWHVVRDATINEEGLSCRVCSVCEASETKTLPKLAHTHSFTGGEEIVTPASCTAEGSKKVYCSNPDCAEYELVTIPKTGHTDHWKVIKEATCTDEGTRSNECSVCGKVLGTEKIAKKGHDYKVSVVPPTETEQGYTLHKCKVCGDEYKDNYTASIDENAVKITVESKKAFAGKTVLVNVILENNPGIWGMDLAVSYDKTKLTLNSVTNGDVFADSEWTKGNLSAESYILSYEANGFENVSGSGVLATLEFTVNDEAQAEDFYEISVSYRSGDIIDAAFAEISPAVVQGGVQVIDVLYGDLNGDGIVNKKDSLLMKMYLADNTTQINEAAADVFPDGAINKKDSLYLKQYLAGLDIELGA